jgi:hypothetical protein
MPHNFSWIPRPDYDGPVFGVAGRRAAEILVGLFALLGFVCVPLGQKTGLQHLMAIGSSPAVAEASLELWGAAQRARERVTRSLVEQSHPAPPSPPSAQPRPQLPKLGQR